MDVDENDIDDDGARYCSKVDLLFEQRRLHARSERRRQLLDDIFDALGVE